MFFKTTTAVIAGVVLAVGLSISKSATAVTADCATGVPNVTGAVVANSGCEFSDLGNAQPSLAEINNENFFNTSDWVELGKINAGSSTGSFTDGGLTINWTDPMDAGTWTINNFDPTLDYLLLFKDGNNKAPSSLIGYLINTTTGTFTNPFFNCQNGTCISAADAISNIRLFSSSGSTVVPLPAGLPLFLTALFGTGLLLYRRRET